MKILRIIRKQGLAAPVFALVVASCILTALVAYRIIVGCQVWHAYLVWNLFLAWLPLMFAVLAAERFGGWTVCSLGGGRSSLSQRERVGVREGATNDQCGQELTNLSEILGDSPSPLIPLPLGEGDRRQRHDLSGRLSGSFIPPDRQDACPTVSQLRDRKFMVLGLAWLLFFPNAPYIFTDVVHVTMGWRQSFWSELMLILLCAMTGFLAGFLSLQVMHGLATRLWGRAAGWLFVVVASGLAGFGVYLGRFARLNSWDVLTNPLRLLEGAGLGVWQLATEWHRTKFLI